MEIYNETKLTYDEVVKYSSNINTKKKLWYIIMGLSVVMILINVLFIVMELDDTYFLLTCGGIILACSIVILYGLPFLVKRGMANFKDGVVYKYTFKDDEITVEAILKGQSSKSELKWTSLEKTNIIGHILYLYINKSSFFMINLNEFTEEDKNIILEKIKSIGK